MRFVQIIFLLLLVAVIGGFGFIAFTDVAVEQNNVTESLAISF